MKTTAINKAKKTSSNPSVQQVLTAVPCRAVGGDGISVVYHQHASRASHMPEVAEGGIHIVLEKLTVHLGKQMGQSTA